MPPLLALGERVENSRGEYWRMRLPVATIFPATLAARKAIDSGHRSEGQPAGHPELAALLASFPGEALFLDLETCGFAGSAIFLIGVVREEAGELVVELLFARNYAEEPAILESLWELAAARQVLVTYNGKSFDWPMVQDRSTRHRFGAARRASLVHCDLLHHARRRWKGSLPDCKLQTLEYCLCGRRRDADIHGERIPAAYHDFVRDGDPTQMEAILRHNAQDLLTLLEISLRILDREPGEAIIPTAR